MKQVLGIVGGMGPLATVELFRLLVETTKSENDAGHIRILIDNNTGIPDRTSSIIGNGASPVPYIVESAKGLRSLGANYILIPCNTSHYYYDQIQREIDIPVINMVEETAKEISEKKYKKVGILATTGTIAGQVYDRYLCERNIELIKPSESQQIAVMDYIYNGVKAGNKAYDVKRFVNTIDDLYKRGAETIILACTEINVGLSMYNIKTASIIEPMKVLAKKAVLRAGYDVVGD